MTASSAHENHKEFWPFSLETYRRDGVEAACLALQDDHGLDVNCVLFCCWAGACGFADLDPQEVDDMVKVSKNWNVQVVQPLRQVRRVLKDRIAAAEGPEAALRQAVKDLELEAEWHEQRLLADLLTREPGAPPSRASAERNLQAYLAHLKIDSAPDIQHNFHILINASFAI